MGALEHLEYSVQSIHYTQRVICNITVKALILEKPFKSLQLVIIVNLMHFKLKELKR